MTQTIEAPRLKGLEKHALDLIEQKAAHKRRKAARNAFNANLGVLWMTTRLGEGDGFKMPNPPPKKKAKDANQQLPAVDQAEEVPALATASAG